MSIHSFITGETQCNNKNCRNFPLPFSTKSINRKNLFALGSRSRRPRGRGALPPAPADDAIRGASSSQNPGQQRALREFHELFRALSRNLAVEFLFAGHGRPTLFFHVVASLPVIFCLHFLELLNFLGILAKLFDTNGCQAADDSFFGHFLTHFLGSTPQDPSTPIESDDGQYIAPPIALHKPT